ncbi:MAG: hypothetical protein P1V97_19555 [Planctomycetota bacterium]|nr:hypothetical protein [Planctomycetota bacterium]
MGPNTVEGVVDSTIGFHAHPYRPSTIYALVRLSEQQGEAVETDRRSFNRWTLGKPGTAFR